MFLSISLVLLIVQSTLSAVISPILVLESTSNGVVYLLGPPLTPASDSTSPSSTTQSALSVSATFSASTSTISSNGNQLTPPITAISASSSSVWPASVTFVAETSSSTAVGVAFVTTVNGTAVITTTKPQQSLVPATESGSGYELIAITESSTTVTLTLNDLPTATLPSQPTGVQVVTDSGIPVTYSPITLSGYDNTEPVEISTTFTESVDGHTTTQGGWWLIGIGGIIFPPVGRPWKIGSGVGCLAGPLVCQKHCISIGPLEICYPGGSGGGGGGDETGPPGFPGGPIDGEGEPGDPPPFEQPSPDEEPEKMSGSDASKATTATSASMTEPASASASTSGTASGTASASSSASTSSTVFGAQYYIVATPGANAANINAFLQQIAPISMGMYAPILSANAVDGGFWTAKLSPEGAASASGRTDLLIVAPYTNTAASYPSWTASAFSETGTVDLETLYASTLLPTETAAAIARRKPSDEGPWSNAGRFNQDGTLDRDADAKVGNPRGERKRSAFSKRDAGIRLVRQPTSPKDLSVLAWAPGVPSVDDVDFIFSERKGEDTWVYILDTAINAQHLEFRTNWPGTFGQFNIDPEVLYGPLNQESDPPFGSPDHGTCMASKVCGARTGVAKQAKVISVVSTGKVGAVLACLHSILDNITSRRAKGEAMPGLTVLSMSFGIPPAVISKKERVYMQSVLQSIMDLGVICVGSAGNSAKNLGFPRTNYPAALTSDTFPYIPVGAVDITGAVAPFTQEGVVYTVGVDSPCAAYNDYQMEDNADGSSGAGATMAGLIALKLSEPGNVYGFGNDKTRYQQLVKDYYTVGYNRRKPALHPPGSWYRPGSFASVAWNGLDGSKTTVCPLIWTPDGAFKKRQATDPATSSDICSAYKSRSVIIYSRVEKGCLNCADNYYLYSVSSPTGVPSKICNGDGFIGSVENAPPTGTSIPFTLPKTTGDSADEDLKFVYAWTAADDSASISGGDLTAPIACVTELLASSALSQTCSFEASDSERKREAQVLPWPSTHLEEYVYAPFARCVWGSA